MRLATRAALVVVGLGTSVYGAAALTGAWLGTPPWWSECVGYTTYSYGFTPAADGTRTPFCNVNHLPGRGEVREDLRGVGYAVVAAGLSLATLGAWPLRRLERTNAPTIPSDPARRSPDA